MKRFEYFYGAQADQFSFIRIPRALITDSTFEVLSAPAKLLYAVLLDRMSLSMRNGWFDDENRAFIIYQIADIQKDLGFSKRKAMDYLTELEEFGLVEKKKRGFGMPSILYVKSFLAIADETANSATDQVTETDNEENYNQEDTEDAYIASHRGAKTDTSDQIDDAREYCTQEQETAANAVMNAGRAGQSEEERLMDLSRGYQTDTSRGAQTDTSRSAQSDTSRGYQTDTSRSAEIDTSEVRKSTPLKNYTEKNKTDSNYNHISSDRIAVQESDAIRYDAEVKAYMELIKENVGYEALVVDYATQRDLVDGICELILETVMSHSETILIASERYPASLVKSKFLKLDFSHIQYVIGCLNKNTTQVKNIKKYLLAALFNAPSTIDGYYRAAVNHDMPQYAF